MKRASSASVRSRLLVTRAGLIGFAFVLVLLAGCSNNPYPDADEESKVLYLPFGQAPKTLDPAVSYGTEDTTITNKVFDSLLEYHYIERPYRLMPSMSENLPSAEVLPDGKVRYTFKLRPHLRFQADPCFSLSLGADGEKNGREVTAQDFVFELQRISDPAVTSPVIEPFSNLVGFREFSEALASRRTRHKAFGARPIHDQYKQAGAFPGAVAVDDRTLQITIREPYPQILYWFAMPFTTPVAWEAVEYYNGKGGRPPLAEHPVSTSSFVVSVYDKQARMVLEANPTWWGLKNPSAPGARFPELPAGPEWDDMRAAVGQTLPFVKRIEYRMEKESIPSFNKFIQGYYDFSGIARESFDKVIHEDGLSEEMSKMGIVLSKDVDPGVYYLGFNMDDLVVGTAGGDVSRAVRQAMSLVVDVKEYLRLFSNNRGLPAHSPIPPGLFGYDENYKNPYRTPNLEKAAALLTSVGLENGIDPKTGKPLRLTFDVSDTSPQARVRFLFWVNQWRRLGINVELSATNYNQFYEKMKKGSYQIYQWGWMADYPDPENFLFLLTGKMARSVSGGPNNTNFQNAEFDRLFEGMRNRENDEERLRMIAEMRKILEVERPWIELFHPESYALSHGWMKNVRTSGLSTISEAKYYDVEVPLRKTARKSWNQPILWPAFAFLALAILIIAPGVWTYYRERT